MPDPDGWLTKSEVNADYYEAVVGDVGFGTEAQAGLHAAAVARLVAMQARSRGKHDLRILKLGANNGAFARSLLRELRTLVASEASDLTRVDYVAVENARPALEAAVEWESAQGPSDSVLRPGVGTGGNPAARGGTLVALLRRAASPPTTNVGLIHADALEFVRSCQERFDVAILNELLDDLPWSAAYRDAHGQPRQVVACARREVSSWAVRINSPPLPGGKAPKLPPLALTARSPCSVELVGELGRVLETQGILLLHDYGLAGPFVDVSTYEAMPRVVPGFARLEFPPGDEHPFPRSFFRVFGDECRRILQITNDVNFEELAVPLRATGMVFTLPHGSAVTSDPGFAGFARGDGVFLSEFGLMQPCDDLAAVLVRLEREQQLLRDRYVRDRGAGRESMFQDLVYVKS